MSAKRFPSSVYRHGTEPDVRFSLANERTFLAWTRTALALIGGGVALEALPLPLEPTLRLVSAFILVGAGILVPAQAWFGWSRAERAIRRGDPLPHPFFAAPLAIAIALVGILLLAAIIVR
ncbi:DUF202 domain-containing protein [Herbiconiux sp. VKM Ac-1786]|uniref:YidH family protein n=1 Tax=Herbiconiux sp. VKM Ac-1786 TaxID=2783824 RepID=UPI00188AC19B|nr:DUF202 domain-containing protein [Herbiconiux sp. VKM Ac-1786]MBF4571918.1 DUF202 domain-containing protein [Herbiconiux sp. VKM Ac-1786]